MNRKLLLSLALWVMGAALPAFGANTLTVYDGENINQYVPVYGYYADDFLKSEYVIPSTSLTDMVDRQITGIKWYLSTSAQKAWGATFTVFIKEVDDTTLTGFTGVEDATIVYEGVLDGTGPEMDVKFTHSYEYKGGNLLIGVYTIVEGEYSSSAFFGTTVEGASVQGYNGASLDRVSASPRNFIPKTTFTYLDAGVIMYNPPTNLTVSEIGTNSATVSWNAAGSETSWDLQYKKAADEDWTSVSTSETSVTLDELSNGTIYDVQVRSNYGEDKLSDWIATQFNTQMCNDEDMADITYEFNDSFEDGWTGNAISVVHHNTGIAVGRYTLVSGKFASGTIKLCYGEEYDFNWISGSYTGECSFKLYDPYGEVIFEHPVNTSISSGLMFSYTPVKVSCARPSALAASEVTNSTAKLTWTAVDPEQSTWEVVYGLDGFNPDDAEVITVNGTPELVLNGLNADCQYTAYVRANCGEENGVSQWSIGVTFRTLELFPTPVAVHVTDVTYKSAKVEWAESEDAVYYRVRYRMPPHKEKLFFESFENGIPSDWTVVDADGDGHNWASIEPSIYQVSGVPLQPFDGTMVAWSQSYSNGSALTPDNWLITKKVPLRGTLKFHVSDDGANPENYRVYVSTTDTEIDSFEPVTEKLVTPSSQTYTEVIVDLSQFDGKEGYIAFRHYDVENQDFIFIDAVGIYGDDIEETDWVTIENITKPICVIEGLNPETPYEVEVQAVYELGQSDWSAPSEFTTTAVDIVPANLTVDFPTCDSGTANWTGIHDIYNIRYRKSLKHQGLFEGFESGVIPKGWENVDADGDGYKWYIFSPESDGLDANGNPTVIGTSCATSASYYNNTALNPDNWLISPEVELKGTFSVWLRGQDPSYPNECFTIYTIIGNDTTVLIPQDTVQILYTEYTADLSPFNGAVGRIAIRHHDTYDQFRLNVDNFFVKHGEDIPEGEWITIENVENPYMLTGLERNTSYDVQVQGVYEGGLTEWSMMHTFKTRDIETISLEEMLLYGDEGMNYEIEDDLIMVSQTPDGQYTYVTDGQDNWVRLAGVSADLFSNAGALSGVQGKYTGSNFNPTVTIDKEITTIIPVDPIVPDGLDLTEGNEEPINIRRCKVMTFSGYAENGKLVAEPGNDFGMTAGTAYFNELVPNEKYDMTVALELLQSLEIDGPMGAPRRISEGEMEFIDMFHAVILESKTEATGVKTVEAAVKGEVRYYDAQGRYVGKTLDSAPAGFYIGSDGSKVIK